MALNLDYDTGTGTKTKSETKPRLMIENTGSKPRIYVGLNLE